MTLEHTLDVPLRDDMVRLFADTPAPALSDGLSQLTRAVAREMAQAWSGESLPLGARVGRYTIHGVLGRGGQGTVYRATLGDGRSYAVKVPRPALVSRLVREAQILFHLDHERIVRIEKAVIDADIPYIATEYLAAGSLTDRLRESGPLSPVQVVGLAVEILDALEYAHAKGVVHRDLKPSNILFDDAMHVKVADFGIGRLGLVEDVGVAGTLVSADRTMFAGTPIYMAPEQEHAGEPIDGRADLYALGKVLYQALTGRSPRTVQPVTHLVPELRPAWDAFLFRLLEDRPEDRFQSAAAARDALARLGGSVPRPPLPLPADPTPLLDQLVSQGVLSPEQAAIVRQQAPPTGAALRSLGGAFGAQASGARFGPPTPLSTFGPKPDESGGPLVRPSRRTVERIAAAVRHLAKSKEGASIALVGDPPPKDAGTGVRLDARVSTSLLQTIFHFGSPLADGAVIVQGDRIVAASCFLSPGRPAPETSLGTRHQAAIGFSQRTGATVIVVSSASAGVSIVERGRLTPIDPEHLVNHLLEVGAVATVPGPTVSWWRLGGTADDAGAGWDRAYWTDRAALWGVGLAITAGILCVSLGLALESVALTVAGGVVFLLLLLSAAWLGARKRAASVSER